MVTVINQFNRFDLLTYLNLFFFSDLIVKILYCIYYFYILYYYYISYIILYIYILFVKLYLLFVKLNFLYQIFDLLGTYLIINYDYSFKTNKKSNNSSVLMILTYLNFFKPKLVCVDCKYLIQLNPFARFRSHLNNTTEIEDALIIALWVTAHNTR